MICASRDKSGLMTKGAFTCALLDRMVLTSDDLFRVTRRGLGRPEGLYFPSLIVSLIA